MTIAHDAATTARSIAETLKTWVVKEVGGPGRLPIILILASVLGLDAADKGTISAVAGQIEKAFDINNIQMGLLIAVVSFIGALASLPMGVLADRVNRRNVLTGVILLWAAAMVVSGTASSYIYLLLTRLFLGAVTAAAWPCVASLVGDFFPARERAGIYGLILSGELIGTGIGFFISGEVSSLANWHWSFYAMAVPSLAIVWLVWRFLPEPERGKQGWISASELGSAQSSGAAQKVLEAKVQPRQHLVLRQDPTQRSLWWAIKYLLQLPTYDLLIIASALAYFFFAGVRAFAMIYLTNHYDLSRSAVSALVFIVGIGALAGFIGGGRLAEWLLRKGYLNIRIVLPAIALYISIPFLGGGIWTTSVWLGIILLTLGTCALAAAVAPIDAARLDIIHPRLWGRGEAGRTVLRTSFEGGAPLLFGAVSVWLGGGANGLMWTFLIMLFPMLVAGSLVLPGMRTYPRDVATAAASAAATARNA
jgi:predicted MFS family arabinose efflux permease